jgi:hypothetical protein
MFGAGSGRDARPPHQFYQPGQHDSLEAEPDVPLLVGDSAVLLYHAQGRPIDGAFIAFSMACATYGLRRHNGGERWLIPRRPGENDHKFRDGGLGGEINDQEHLASGGVPIERLGLELFSDVGEERGRTTLGVDRVSSFHRCLKLNQVFHRMPPGECLDMRFAAQHTNRSGPDRSSVHLILPVEQEETLL